MASDTSTSSMVRQAFPAYGIAGAGIILCAEAGLVLGVQLIGVYFTPIVWTGYILFVDGLLSLRGESVIKTNTRKFVFMLPWSVICWLVFEAYNLRLQNWTYVGLPEDLLPRVVGYVWSFATIFPAVLLTSKLIELQLPSKPFGKERALGRPTSLVLVAVGVLMLIVPLVVSEEASSTMFGLVWLGFIFLLDPLNYLRGRNSVIHRVLQGNANTLSALLLAGCVCGILWEFWNYWATAKWIYSIPISFAGPKIFEMPLLGYLGFLPFAVECYVMNEFLYTLFPKLERR